VNPKKTETVARNSTEPEQCLNERLSERMNMSCRKTYIVNVKEGLISYEYL
jgi:hypothetical protein